ncbi:hypothetical protein SCA03_09450 [Streptomyces cacaoi]|uniref:Uncharacterized protein n=2 Tax=Streptomyces cacaoi TaxID=1898 RepID=A0A4Y3QSK9_STRCI|nr:hypothetical protein SCA03_09450 [Streptomyces cacaoi]
MSAQNAAAAPTSMTHQDAVGMSGSNEKQLPHMAWLLEAKYTAHACHLAWRREVTN